MNREALDRYREAIEQTAEAEKALIDCRARLAIIDKEIELSGMASTTPPKTKTERFIDEHRGELDTDDIEFLSTTHRGGKETADYLAVSESTLKRLADDGTLEVRRTGAGHRRYCTLSVVRHLITGRESQSD
ncbi:MerR family transcriptional regulator [Rhodopirellula baltica]